MHAPSAPVTQNRKADLELGPAIVLLPGARFALRIGLSSLSFRHYGDRQISARGGAHVFRTHEARFCPSPNQVPQGRPSWSAVCATERPPFSAKKGTARGKGSPHRFQQHKENGFLGIETREVRYGPNHGRSIQTIIGTKRRRPPQTPVSRPFFFAPAQKAYSPVPRTMLLISSRPASGRLLSLDFARTAGH